jgi:hypothetical protein
MTHAEQEVGEETSIVLVEFSAVVKPLEQGNGIGLGLTRDLETRLTVDRVIARYRRAVVHVELFDDWRVCTQKKQKKKFDH